MKRIRCSNPTCDRVFAHVLDEGTIDVVRQSHKFTTVGENFNVIGTCAQCPQKNFVSVKDSKLVEEGLTFKENDNGKKPHIEAKTGSKEAGESVEDSAVGGDDQQADSGEPEQLPAIGDSGSGSDNQSGTNPGTEEVSPEGGEVSPSQEPTRSHTRKV